MKDFLKTVAGIVLFFAVAIGVLTFMRNIIRQPSVVLTETECDPPCWYKIKPGRTNPAQVYATLGRLEIVNQETIMGDYAKYDILKNIFWYFQYPAVDSAGSIYFDDDRVTAISFLTIDSLKLADLFEKFGQPEKYWAEIGYGENREYLDVTLFFPTQWLVANVLIDIAYGANQVEIKSTTPVFRVTYIDPEMLPELLETRLLVDTPFNARTGSFQTWSGFGTILFERK